MHVYFCVRVCPYLLQLTYIFSFFLICLGLEHAENTGTIFGLGCRFASYSSTLSDASYEERPAPRCML